MGGNLFNHDYCMDDHKNQIIKFIGSNDDEDVMWWNILDEV